jgi:haloalkane dehalogenase
MVMNSPINISGFRRLYPFKSHYLNLNGLKYHYLDEGAGDPVLMIHGNPTWSFYFRKLVRELSADYRAIAVDHIGCGLSDKPEISKYDYRLKSRIDDLDALFAHLNPNKKLTLIMHDWGGMIGMAFALRHWKKIGRLVIMNTAAFLPSGKKKLPLRLWVIRNCKILSKLAVQGFNIFSYAALFMASFKGLAGDVKAGLKAPYNSWQNRIATLKFVQDIPVTEKDPSYHIVKKTDDDLYKLSGIPMLICWGKHDFVFDDTYLKEWKRRFPKAILHYFTNAGHYVLEDEPDKICATVKTFFKNNPIRNEH